MSEVSKIGLFQLENLRRQKVTFSYFDLREEAIEAEGTNGILQGSMKVSARDLLASIQQQGLEPNAPIILICEDGTRTAEAARSLEENGYINVFIIDGGLIDSRN